MTLTRLAPGELRRLPGVSFEAVPGTTSGVLPRLDVTGFVGYAEAGPIDVPVLVEDPARFRDIFGEDVELASGRPDREVLETGTRADDPVLSLLGPTVEAFFANGGRSCWVVRVGEDAVTSAFVVPGLVSFPRPGSLADAGPATVVARSAGAHFDAHTVVARARRRTLPALTETLDLVGWLDGTMVVPASATVGPGDLLEIVRGDGSSLWVPVASVEPDRSGDADAGRQRLSWAAIEETWLRPVTGESATVPRPVETRGPSGTTVATVRSFEVGDDGQVQATFDVGVADAPGVGDLVIVDPDTAQPLIFTVDREPVGEAAAGVGALRTVVHGWPAWRLLSTASARSTATTVERVAVVELDIAADRGEAHGAPVDRLGFTPTHPRWWGRLPCDEEIFDRSYRAAAGGVPSPPLPLEEAVSVPRFAVGVPEALAERPSSSTAPTGAPSSLPLGLGAAFGASGIGRALGATAGSNVRNGLARHRDTAFIDPDLATLGTETLREEARRRFFVEGRRLRGLHGLLPIDDVAVIAVPDALHSGWRDEIAPRPPILVGPMLTIDPETGRLSWNDPFADLAPPETADEFILERAASPDFTGGVETSIVSGTTLTIDIDAHRCDLHRHRIHARRDGRTSPWSNTVVRTATAWPFGRCETEVDAPPVATLAERLLTWTTTVGPYEVEQCPRPLFDSPTTSVTTPDTSLTLPTPTTTFVHVRVRSVAEPAAPGPWSNTVVLRAVPETRSVSLDPDPTGPSARSEIALSVHRALAVVAAARRDLTVLVSFPRWYGTTAIEDHLGELALDPIRGSSSRSGFDHLHAHHPWTLVPGARPSSLPPDGAIAGRLAEVALGRGPWIAAVQSPLTGAVGLAADLAEPDRYRLRLLQVNALEVSRGGIVVTGVDTLSFDITARPVTVRRLLILVRRLALREGNELIFENNGPDLHRRLRTRFEAALGLLFRLGAFAGSTPSEGYRVLCDEGLNPPRVIDAGQVIVELQVAPAHPLEFIVVRLVQGGEGAFRLAEVA